MTLLSSVKIHSEKLLAVLDWVSWPFLVILVSINHIPLNLGKLQPKNSAVHTSTPMAGPEQGPSSQGAWILQLPQQAAR